MCVCSPLSKSGWLGNSSFVLIFLTPHWRNIPHSTRVFSRPHCLCVWFKLFSLSYHITSFFLCSFPDHNSPGINSYSCCQGNFFFFCDMELQNVFPDDSWKISFFPLSKKRRVFFAPLRTDEMHSNSPGLWRSHTSLVSLVRRLVIFFVCLQWHKDLSLSPHHLGKSRRVVNGGRLRLKEISHLFIPGASRLLGIEQSERNRKITTFAPLSCCREEYPVCFVWIPRSTCFIPAFTVVHGIIGKCRSAWNHTHTSKRGSLFDDYDEFHLSHCCCYFNCLIDVLHKNNKNQEIGHDSRCSTLHLFPSFFLHQSRYYYIVDAAVFLPRWGSS